METETEAKQSKAKVRNIREETRKERKEGTDEVIVFTSSLKKKVRV